MGGTHCTIQRQLMDYKSDRMNTTRMAKETKNEMEGHPRPVPGSSVAKTSRRQSREGFHLTERYKPWR